MYAHAPAQSTNNCHFIAYYTVLQRLHKGMNCIFKEGKYYVTIYSHGGYLQEANQIVCLRAKMAII